MNYSYYKDFYSFFSKWTLLSMNDYSVFLLYFCYVDNYISPLSTDFSSDSFFQVLETFQFVTPSIIHHDPRIVTLLCPIMVIVTH